MADPRFYDNRGPFALVDLCARAGVALPDGVEARAQVRDIASLTGAGSAHLSFFMGGKKTESLHASKAGFCFIPARGPWANDVPAGMAAIPCTSVAQAFAMVARAFYPEAGLDLCLQDEAVHPTAVLGENVRLGRGAVVGPGAEIGAGSMIGAGSVIGRGVAIGRGCEIGANVTISHAYLGDAILILPGARIGQPGFGFASSSEGHMKIPQLGRVIIQDRVEVGAGTTIDRGALGDTVIGEGTKIDNLVQIGHNVHIGRHCMIVSQVGIAGSSELGDFVVMGGQAATADHVRIGVGARFAARAAAAPGAYPGGKDYGGTPARPLLQWKRELAAVTLLAKRGKRDRDA